MRLRKPFVAILSFAGSISLVSCVVGLTPNARYSPMGGATPAAFSTVAVKVIDDREEKLGGREKNLVGQARGGYGNPFGVHEARLDTVSTLIKAATVDALLSAGVSVRDTDDRTLVVTVKKYWADGYRKYNADIDVSFQLLAMNGGVTWQSTVRASESGKLGMKPKARMKSLFEDTLKTFAKNAVAEFKTPAFRGGPAEEARTLSLRGERVRVTTSNGDVTPCKFLGDLKPSPPFVGEHGGEHALRNGTAELGGDVVLTSNRIGDATGKAYDCGGKYTK